MTDIVRAFAEDAHPRGTGALGGQFIQKQGAAKKAAPKKAAPKSKPGSGNLSFDGKRGTGYGVKGGDKRVRGLQEALNRLGLTDANGKKLVVDGKLGPKTTAAIKKAQRALGLKADGVVTPALLKQLTTAKTLTKAPPKKAMPAKKAGGATTKPRPAAPAKSAPRKATPASTTRRSEVTMPRPTFHRSYALDNIEVVSRAKGGDGRTVEAYAAVFDTPTEVKDQHGHYMETIHRSAFNRTLNSGRPPLVLYNHGLTLDGAVDSLAQVPIGTAVSVTADERGLLTVTRYNKSALADSILASIENGDIKAQSFRGAVYGSEPRGRVPRVSRGGSLPTVTRTELGLSDYGPTPVPYYTGALITAVRSMTDVAAELAELDDDARAELIRALQATPATGSADSASPYLGHGTEDTPALAGLSGRDIAAVQRKIRTARILGRI
jgi:HK97 family phage prohead protease